MSETKTVVITGGNSGIGFRTAQELGQKGWRVVITGRSQERLQSAAETLRAEDCQDVSALVGDFASLSSVRGLAQQLEQEPRIDVLLNNAGVSLSHRQVSKDGNEMMLQVNHLATFLLTNLLLDKLKASAPSRIINLSSRLHRRARSYGFDDFQFEKSYGTFLAYARTKLYSVMFAKELARRLAGSGVTANAIHPGEIATSIGRDGDFTGWKSFAWPIVQALLMSGEEDAARVPVFAATDPALAKLSGRYFGKGLTEESVNPLAENEAAAKRLWAKSEALVGLA